MADPVEVTRRIANLNKRLMAVEAWIADVEKQGKKLIDDAKEIRDRIKSEKDTKTTDNP